MKEIKVMTNDEIILLAVVCQDRTKVATRIKEEDMGPFFRVLVETIHGVYKSHLIPDRYWPYFSNLSYRGKMAHNRLKRIMGLEPSEDVRELLFKYRGDVDR